MKIFDYFYENYLVPLVENFNETIFSCIAYMLEWLLSIVLFVTVPVWLIPYLIIKHIKERNDDSNEKH